MALVFWLKNEAKFYGYGVFNADFLHNIQFFILNFIFPDIHPIEKSLKKRSCFFNLAHRLDYKNIPDRILRPNKGP